MTGARPDAYARLVGMSAAFGTSNAARTAISFAMSLVIARGLGLDDFGRWTLCMAWAAMLTMTFDLGFGVLLTRDAAREVDTGPAVGAALIVRLGVLLPVAAVLAAVPQWLSPDPAASRGLRVAPLIAAAGVAYGCLAPVFRTSPRALVATLGLETVGALSQWAAAWWILDADGGVVALLVMAAAVQAGQFVAALALWRLVGTSAPLVARPSRATVLQVARAAIPFAAAGLIANAQLRIAPLLLGVLSGAPAVAAFGVAARIGGLARMLPQAAFAGALPVLSQEVRHGSGVVRARFDRALTAFSFAIAIVIAMLAGPLVSMTYGAGFGGAVTPLVWIAIGLVPTLINSGRKLHLYASGHETLAVRWSAAALAVQAVAIALLIPSWGAAGAAAGLALGEAVVAGPLKYSSDRVQRMAGTHRVNEIQEGPEVRLHSS